MITVPRKSFVRSWFPFILSAFGLLLAVLQAEGTIGISYQMQLGNPSGAIADTNNHSHYLIQRTVEAMDYSDANGEPNWVSWDLTASDVGNASRSTTYFTDTNLPANFYWVTDTDYNGVGTINFNRGHMCPSEDRTDTEADNDWLFFMSNIIPQAADNNQKVWETFETYCRSLTATNELLITCGPSGFGTNRIPSGKAYIADYVWKMAVCVPLGGGTALSRITPATRVIALKTPNINGLSTQWTSFVTSARQIELDTGYTFFSALPPNLAWVLRSKVDGQTPPAPAIVSFSPASGIAGGSVTITGTNLSFTTNVTLNGLSAAFNIDSPTQLTATVPDTATSGYISVMTLGGSVTSSSSFIVTTGTASDLAVTATHTGNFTQGDTGDTYTIVVTNLGPDASMGAISLADSLPAGLTATAMSGAGWTADLGTLTCTRSDTLAASAAFPPITLTVNVAPNAPASVTNLVTISGGGDTNPANNTAGDVTVIDASVISTTNIVISQVYGGGGNTGAAYQNDFIELYNRGATAVDLSVYSVQYASATSANWTAVNLNGSLQPLHYYLVQLASSGTNGAYLPVPDLAAISLNLNASSGKIALVGSQTLLTVTNPAGSGGVLDFVGYGAANAFEGSGPAPAPAAGTADLRADGGATDTDDNAADFAIGSPTPRNSLGTSNSVDLVVSATHRGNFTQGDLGDTYTIVVTNAGTAPSVGVISLTDTLPAGLTATAISGTDWTANLSSLVCTYSNSIFAGASSPPITLTVNVSSSAASSVTNVAAVSGGGDANVINNTASDPTAINTSVVSTNLIVLAGWNTSGLSNYGPSPFSATTNAANLTVGGLTRGSGVATNSSGAGRAWGGNNFVGATAAAAIASSQFVTFTMTANQGYRVSCSTISRFDYRRSSTGPPYGLLQYQIGSGEFADIASLSYPSNASSGASLGPISLSGISALQNVAAGTAVTFRIVNYGASGSGGTWYIFDTLTNSAADLEIQGTVSPQVVPVSDLVVFLSHAGDFTQGDANDSYTITVTNVGTAATAGTVSITDTLPSGLTALAISGAGWTVGQDTLTCIRSDALAAGSTYPPITVAVRVSTTAPACVTNIVTVSGGGQTNTINDTASDATTIIPLTPIQLWRLNYFGAIANSGVAADTAIATSDGMPNLLKYALGLDPLVATNDPIVGDIGSGYLRLTVPKNPNATDVSFHVEVTGDLAASDWTSSGTTTNLDTATLLQVQDDIPVPSASSRFMRLRVSRP